MSTRTAYRRAIYYWAAENQRLCSASLILMLAININELGPSGRLQRQRAASHGQCVYVGSDACVVLLNDDICYSVVVIFFTNYQLITVASNGVK